MAEITTLREKVVVLLSFMIGHNIIMDEDSEEETDVLKVQKSRQVIVKVQNYAEIVVPAMSDETFRGHFRLTRATFTSLHQRLSVLLNDETGRPIA